MGYTIRDAFDAKLYKAVEMTDVINRSERTSTPIRDLGIFEPKYLTTTDVGLEVVKSTIQQVPSSPRGTSGAQRNKDKRAGLKIEVPHYQEDSTITSDEIRGVFATGGDFLKNMESCRNERINEMAVDLDHTEEAILQGATRGEVLDADGSLLYSSFDLFGFEKPDAELLDSSGASGSIKQYAQNIRRLMAAALGVDGNRGFTIRAQVGNDFYDHIVNAEETQKAYERYQEGAFLREGGLAYEEFMYAGVLWTNVQPSDDGAIGVAANKAHFFPVIKGMFKSYYAPSDRIIDIGGAALERYSWGQPDWKGKAIECEAQFNLLALMAKPLALREGEIA